LGAGEKIFNSLLLFRVRLYLTLRSASWLNNPEIFKLTAFACGARAVHEEKSVRKLQAYAVLSSSNPSRVREPDQDKWATRNFQLENFFVRSLELISDLRWCTLELRSWLPEL
jgi:hypothetical protein